MTFREAEAVIYKYFGDRAFLCRSPEGKYSVCLKKLIDDIDTGKIERDFGWFVFVDDAVTAALAISGKMVLK